MNQCWATKTTTRVEPKTNCCRISIRSRLIQRLEASFATITCCLWLSTGRFLKHFSMFVAEHTGAEAFQPTELQNPLCCVSAGTDWMGRKHYRQDVSWIFQNLHPYFCIYTRLYCFYLFQYLSILIKIEIFTSKTLAGAFSSQWGEATEILSPTHWHKCCMCLFGFFLNKMNIQTSF